MISQSNRFFIHLLLAKVQLYLAPRHSSRDCVNQFSFNFPFGEMTIIICASLDECAKLEISFHYNYLTTTLSKLTPIWTHPKMPLFGPFFGTFSHFQPQITGNVLSDPPGCQPNSLEPFKGKIWMSPKNSHGFQNVSIFLQNLFKSFESQEPGFLQRITLELPLGNSPTTIWACPAN